LALALCRLRVDHALGHLGQLFVGLLFLLQRLSEQVGDLAVAHAVGVRDSRAVAGDLVMLGALGGGN